MSYYNVKVYDTEEGFERETIRGLNLTQSLIIMEIFDREGIQAQSMKYDDEGKFVHGEGQSVNWD